MKAKSGLNRSILDQGWFDSGDTLNTNKSGWAGEFLQYRHETPAGNEIYHEANADVGGEIVPSNYSMKQEPTEAIQAIV